MNAIITAGMVLWIVGAVMAIGGTWYEDRAWRAEHDARMRALAERYPQLEVYETSDGLLDARWVGDLSRAPTAADIITK